MGNLMKTVQFHSRGEEKEEWFFFGAATNDHNTELSELRSRKPDSV